MTHKKYMFIIAFLGSIFISVTTWCGTTFKYAACCVEKKQASNELYYENYSLVLIKYFY